MRDAVREKTFEEKIRESLRLRKEIVKVIDGNKNENGEGRVEATYKWFRQLEQERRTILYGKQSKDEVYIKSWDVAELRPGDVDDLHGQSPLSPHETLGKVGDIFVVYACAESQEYEGEYGHHDFFIPLQLVIDSKARAKYEKQFREKTMSKLAGKNKTIDAVTLLPTKVKKSRGK